MLLEAKQLFDSWYVDADVQSVASEMQQDAEGNVYIMSAEMWRDIAKYAMTVYLFTNSEEALSVAESSFQKAAESVPDENEGTTALIELEQMRNTVTDEIELDKEKLKQHLTTIEEEFQENIDRRKAALQYAVDIVCRVYGDIEHEASDLYKEISEKIEELKWYAEKNNSEVHVPGFEKMWLKATVEQLFSSPYYRFIASILLRQDVDYLPDISVENSSNY